jgi:membrane associated rhomboid family serine protease
MLILIAFLASFFAEYSLPTVGASGMVYAMIGMYIGLLLLRKIRILKKDLYIFLISIGLMFAISVFKHNSNYILHAICFISGILFIMFNNILIHDELQ